ncbi:MAG: efflux RND transporter periplasmic adaptor subunit, partial [Planctomycetota bacterium]
AIALLMPREVWFVDDADRGGGGAVLLACPMHPQIQSYDPTAHCPLCGMKLEPVHTSDALDEHARGMIGLQTAKVELLALVQRMQVLGRIEVDETRREHIAARAGGRIEKLHANTIGMEVRKGDHVADLYSPQLYAAQEEHLTNVRAAAEAGPMQPQMQRLADVSRGRLQLFGLTDEQIVAIERGGPRPTLTVTAPQGGVLVGRHVLPGQYVKEGEMLLEIADLNTVWLVLDVYEHQLPLIRQGQRVAVTTESNPGYESTGWVEFVEPLVDRRTRTARVRVTLPNPRVPDGHSPMPGATQARRYSPGMFATATIEAVLDDQLRPLADHISGDYSCPMHPEVHMPEPGDCPKCGMALEHRPLPEGIERPGDLPPLRALPDSAILDSGRHTVVYLLTADTKDGMKFELREVTVGPPMTRTDKPGDLTLYRPVLGGVDVGDFVAAQGNFLLDSQAQIRGKPSLFFPKGAAGAAGSGNHASHSH